MNLIRIPLALTLALGLSACASTETVSRSTPFPAGLGDPIAALSLAPLPAGDSHSVSQVTVHVPQSLTSSEANRYYPKADIVWREDPLGDRHAQVSAIVQAAAQTAVQGITLGRDVNVDIQVARFHAVTEKARYTVGGVHNVHYVISISDAQDGSLLLAPRLVELSLQAYGGARAIEAMSRGETQKHRITQMLIGSIRDELHQSIAPAPQPLQLSAISSRGI